MDLWVWILILAGTTLTSAVVIWTQRDRRYKSSASVASAYDAWTNDQLLERLWGEHVHLGYYGKPPSTRDFRAAKQDFVHELVQWSGLAQLPRGSRVLDVGCGIGGSARILARDYNFEVLGITISPAQVKRASQLTPEGMTCQFQVMDALDLKLANGSFDAVWSVEAGPHMPDKQRYADELLRVLRPKGVLALADWNRRDYEDGEMTSLERWVMRQLLDQWAHPEFASIKGFRRNLLHSPFACGTVESDDWTRSILPSWNDSILEGVRRPGAVLGLGPAAVVKGFREIPTILLMRWAFAHGLMQFGVFRSRD
ncbi:MULTISPECIES: methyltransferase domain-containing protein [Prochlorococcus]|uniref:methyltransferase domain-containing protein n=1 Tax=Prochlorococcus TaxID=1218 RepID=UPI0007B3F236|nr:MULTISPECIES: methyltransferase domain-containing protein [Prochlorococcus]KZR63672.1 Demethylrebeccamycin-D-glucose O-methyltransferase [Prochlorococcus marinus str. MIT 1312]KZR78826.1 Demethylrebeccamycin-D-glucose O-methyltransferase [Prochlorococcus marinus str. MIT 1327]